MRSHWLQNATKRCAWLESFVIGDGDVMASIDLSG